jgi:NDP-sugar pyrophosphorylase family protein
MAVTAGDGRSAVGASASGVPPPPPPPTSYPPEFVAVVLASSIGTRLYPMSSDELPKHMLPVVGIPILFRLLQTLEACGFIETFVTLRHDDTVTREAFLHPREPLEHPYKVVKSSSDTSVGNTSPHHGKMQALQPLIVKSSQMKVTLVNFASPCSGSIEAIRLADAYIPSRSHIVIFPGDLIALNAEPIKSLIHTHRCNSSGIPMWSSGSLTSHPHRNGMDQDRPIMTATTQYDISDQDAPAGDLQPPVACTVLLVDVSATEEQTGQPILKETAKQKKGLLSRDEDDVEYIAIVEENDQERLVWKQSKLDVEEDKDMAGTTPKFILPKARVRSSGVTRIRTEWNDVHCYCLSPWVRRLLLSKPLSASFQSVQYDVLPLLIARQYRGVPATFGSNVAEDVLPEALQQYDWFPNSKQVHSRAALSTHVASSVSLVDHESDHGADSRAASHKDSEYTVLAHVSTLRSHSTVSPVLFRSHTITAYLFANRVLAHELSAATPQHPAVLASLPKDAMIKGKFHSIFLPHCVVAEKVTYKSSIFGLGCDIGTNCRLNNVVLYDGVRVGANTTLQNTMVGANVTIGENCNINDCQVVPDIVIPASTKKKSEAILDDN